MLTILNEPQADKNFTTREILHLADELLKNPHLKMHVKNQAKLQGVELNLTRTYLRDLFGQIIWMIIMDKKLSVLPDAQMVYDFIGFDPKINLAESISDKES